MRPSLEKKFTAIKDGKEFRIERDLAEVGWYLYVYKDGNCLKDYLQDSVQELKTLALDEYGIDENAWSSG